MLRGAQRDSLHNLRDIDVDAARSDGSIVVTGVSGSGKSTLARDVLHDNLSTPARTQQGQATGARRL